MAKLTKNELKEQKRLEKELEEAKREKQAKRKQYTIWAGLALLLLCSAASIFFLLSRPSAPTPTIETPVNTSLPPVTAMDYQTSTSSAKATLIEYGDFQCPACGHYFPMVTRLKEEYKDKLNVVYRNFPLVTVHQNAMMAARAAYAAGKQGKFWEMHDLLYKNQEKWSESATADQMFTIYANDLQMNPVQFTLDMSSDEARNAILASSEGGTKAGVTGTPTFYLNGHQLTNPTTYEEFKMLVDQALGSSK